MEVFYKIFGAVVSIPIEQMASYVPHIPITMGAENSYQFVHFIIDPRSFKFIFKLFDVPVVIIRGISSVNFLLNFREGVMLFCDSSPIFIGFSQQKFPVYFFNPFVEDDPAVHAVSIELGDFPEDGEFVDYLLLDGLV